MLPHSFQLRGKCDAVFLHAGADGAVVGFCDALGDGEADAEAAGRSGAGGVRPVEAVKQAVQRPVRVKRQGEIAHGILCFLIERPLRRLLRLLHGPHRVRAGLRLPGGRAGVRPFADEVEHIVDIPVRGYEK